MAILNLCKVRKYKQNKPKQKRGNWMAAGKNGELGESIPFNYAHLATWNQDSGELNEDEVGVIPLTTEIWIPVF